jgi:hypothetical protein
MAVALLAVKKQEPVCRHGGQAEGGLYNGRRI